MASPTILLVNPNTSVQVTERLAAEARRAAAGRADIRAVTAPRGVPGIQTLQELAAAGSVVTDIVREHNDCAAAIVAAFGDPGLDDARAAVTFPVVGLAESGMLVAGARGRRFAIVTVGEAMRPAVEAKLESLGLSSQVLQLHFLTHSVLDVVRHRDALMDGVVNAVNGCAREGAETVLIGGGPFVGLAHIIALRCDVPVIDGMQAAVSRALEAVRLRPQGV